MSSNGLNTDNSKPCGGSGCGFCSGTCINSPMYARTDHITWLDKTYGKPEGETFTSWLAKRKQTKV